MLETRTLSGAALALALRKMRAVTRSCVDDLSDAQWQVPEQPGLNPVAWTLGHLAWFGEFWVLRGPHRVGDDGLVHAARPPRIAGPDELYDPAQLAHDRRWSAGLPSREQAVAMLDAQLDACVEAVPATYGDDAALYFHRLALLYEAQQIEALTCLRAALGYAAPHHPSWHHVVLPRFEPGGKVQVAGGNVTIGWPADRRGFTFDNELQAHAVTLAPFEVDLAPLLAGPFVEFIEAGGYDDPAYWPGAAGAWRRRSGRHHPVRWRGEGDEWEHRWFDHWLPVDPDQMVVNVSAWEAEAYCRWAGRRLPRAAEWEHAAASSSTFLWGRSVWEWTADDFLPYPGFAPGPYKDYSAPCFRSHRELRGGSFSTHVRLHDARFRNFLPPGRTDAFAGFRTVTP